LCVRFYFNIIILQDTVVALQALALFAQRVYGRGLDVNLSVVGAQGQSKRFHVHHGNSIVLQRQDLNKPTTELTVKAKGEGCVMVQVRN